MRIYGLVQDSIVDGPGFRFACFVQGCPHRCPGCHNPDSHNSSGGKEMDVEQVIQTMRSNPLTDGLTLSGGEPMEQAKECLRLAQAAHGAGLNVWCYTGYTYEFLRKAGTPEQNALLEAIDVLVDGPFLLEERTLSLPWRGSRNQRLIHVPASLAAGAVITLPD